MKHINFWLVFITVIVLGLSAGAMLGEQQTLVPYWQELSPDAFYIWYEKNASRLKGFFGPLQISGAVLALLAAVSCRIQRHSGTFWLAISAFLGVAVLATFFLFFRETNAGFVAGKMSALELSTTLSKWAVWQWIRIGLGVSAFGAALYGASKGGAELTS